MVVNPNKKKLKDKMTKRSPTNLKKRMMMKTQGMAKKRMPLRKKREREKAMTIIDTSIIIT
jgi:hypothetical protein